MKITFRPVRLVLLCLALALGLPSTGFLCGQTVPALVNYQGRLANPDGTALATGDYQLTFRVYDSATNNNTPIWGPQVFDGPAVPAQGHGAKIPVVQGYFNVMLGPVDTNGVSLANAFNATNRFVEITISNRPPILPRQQILSAPFAFNSAKLAGADWSAVFGTNDPVNGKIPTTKLATNGVILAQQIGVGTSTPQAQADIAGSLRVISDANANGLALNAAFRVARLDNTNKCVIVGYDSTNSGFVQALHAYLEHRPLGLNPMGGNVGIGKLNPATTLDVNGAVTATAFSGSGTALTSLNANNLSSGTVPDGRLSSNVELLGANQIVSGTRTFSSAVTMNSSLTVATSIGVGTAVPWTSLHVHGSAIHSSGGNAGLSFNDRSQGPVFEGTPAPGNRWEWYSLNGVARLISNDDKISVKPNGNVGIGVLADNKLEVAGAIAASGGFKCRTGTGGSYGGNVFNFSWNGNIQAYIDNTLVGTLAYAPSDRRLKEDINYMETGALERVMQLNPVSFKYKSIPDSIFCGSPDTHEGFIADKLQEIIPSAVTGEKGQLTTDGKIQPQTISITPVVAVLTKAVQEQQQIIEAQKQRMDALEQRLSEMEHRAQLHAGSH